MAVEYAIFRQRLDKNMMNNPSIMEAVAAGPFETAEEAAAWIVENHTDEFDYFVVPTRPKRLETST